MRPDDPDLETDPAPFPQARAPSSPFPPWPEDVRADDPPSDWIEAAAAHQPAVAPARSDHPLASLGRFAFPPGPPTDDEAMAARDRRWTGRVIAMAVVVLAVFNGASVQNWARQQAPGWVSSTVQQLADVWTAQVGQLGADRPRQAVHDAYAGAKATPWPGQTRPQR